MDEIIFGVTFDETSQQFEERIIGMIESQMGIDRRPTMSESVEALNDPS